MEHILEEYGQKELQTLIIKPAGRTLRLAQAFLVGGRVTHSASTSSRCKNACPVATL